MARNTEAQVGRKRTKLHGRKPRATGGAHWHAHRYDAAAPTAAGLRQIERGLAKVGGFIVDVYHDAELGHVVYARVPCNGTTYTYAQVCQILGARGFTSCVPDEGWRAAETAGGAANGEAERRATVKRRQARVETAQAAAAQTRGRAFLDYVYGSAWVSAPDVPIEEIARSLSTEIYGSPILPHDWQAPARLFVLLTYLKSHDKDVARVHHVYLKTQAAPYVTARAELARAELALGAAETDADYASASAAYLKAETVLNALRGAAETAARLERCEQWLQGAPGAPLATMGAVKLGAPKPVKAPRARTMTNGTLTDADRAPTPAAPVGAAYLPDDDKRKERAAPPETRQQHDYHVHTWQWSKVPEAPAINDELQAPALQWFDSGAGI